MGQRSEVHDHEELLRRVHWRQTDSEGRLTSAAFKDRELSVDRAALTDIEALAAAFPSHGIARLLAGLARSAGDVVADPLPDNQAHALVICKESSHAGLSRFARTLKRLAETTWEPAVFLPVRQRAEAEEKSTE
jgi:hypothetical protein